MSCVDSSLWVKICGLKQPEQAVAIARLGANAIGFISVRSSPRYVAPSQMRAISNALLAHSLDVERVGVFANADLATISDAVAVGQLTALQLHGQESLEVCATIREAYPTLKLIKAFRIRSEADLQSTLPYEKTVDALLLDAYHPQLLGGTGQTIDWSYLKAFQPNIPWFLAGGLTPDNIQRSLTLLSPDGIDVSSGVEVSPGNKSLEKVQCLFAALRCEGDL